ncbi:MAG: S1 RNA-binding domain-containing protein [Eubacterium sp.]|nr:S1 RNA-binding domain-containing protein [Eubacterium sp.]
MKEITPEKKYLSDFIGTTQTLVISRLAEHGAYLTFDKGSLAVEASRPAAPDLTSRSTNKKPAAPEGLADEVLLPQGQLLPEMKPGSRVEVFLYKDSEDRLIATTERPRLQLGELAVLKVVDVTNIGAFLDWGLAKDLFLPFKEQTAHVRPGDEIPVALYIDKSERLCATMHIYDYLSTDSPFQKNDRIRGRVYEITDSFGVFVAVDDRYHALIPHNEITRDFRVGEILEARVKEVRPDGKLTLSLQEKTKVQMRSDADRIYARLTEAGGFLPFHDKTAPAIINREFGISKAAFKRALGRLKKEGRITIAEDGIRTL